MMWSHTRLALAAAVAGLIGMPALATPPVAQKAKISMPRARQIALNAQPGGKIIHEELEKERGGSGLRRFCGLRLGFRLFDQGQPLLLRDLPLLHQKHHKVHRHVRR